MAVLRAVPGSLEHANCPQFLPMTSFCTNCGAVIGGDTRFCTACGAVRENEQARVNDEARANDEAPDISPPPTVRRRTWPWWVLVVIAFFLLGLWLGRGPAAKKPLCGAPATAESGPGKMAQGPGKPLKVGRGGPGDPPDFSGGGGHSKIPRGNGPEGAGVDGDGDDAGGAGGGKSPAGDSGGASADGGGDQLKHDLRRFTQGKGDAMAGQSDDLDKVSAQGRSYSANDFTYDKTNLPRYPESVSAVVSSITYAPGGRTDTYSTGAGIVTSSSFDTVVGWYRENLPPGWHDMTIGNFQQLSGQLSVQSITQMLGGQPSGNPAASSSSGDSSGAGEDAGGSSDAAASNPAAEQIRLSLFSPPAGTKGKTSVMIVQHGDSPVEALLQAKVAPSP
jgi:zinc-ribbon domain